jgi:hypothetical protein
MPTSDLAAAAAAAAAGSTQPSWWNITKHGYGLRWKACLHCTIEHLYKIRDIMHIKYGRRACAMATG